MWKKIIAVVLLSALIMAGLYSRWFYLEPVTMSSRTYSGTIVLLPLDSRPPCTQFVAQLASLAGFRLIIPDETLLDHYQQPANQAALRQWLLTMTREADAVIVSTDMLIHGSLLQSRRAGGYSPDFAVTLELLRTLHEERPGIPIYAFSILPRLLIADTNDSVKYQSNMLKYSVLMNQLSLFDNPLDAEKMQEVERGLPADVIARYSGLYAANASFHQDLLQLVKENVLAGVIIGQDDGFPFGIPNMYKQLLQHRIEQDPALTGKVFLTRGTDEVALTLLGHIVSRQMDAHPRVFVSYSTPTAAQTTMPFMPNTVRKTVLEKLAIAGCHTVEDVGQADFILYVHVGTKQTTLHEKAAAAKQVAAWLNNQRPVALVDLSESFQAEETLLPVLLEQHVPVAQLIAYAGWNTTSNSVGTAVTQAAIFSVAQKKYQDDNAEIAALYQENLGFLVSRFLDDFYYQKTVHPVLNKSLQQLGYNPSLLGAAYPWANQFIQYKLRYAAAELWRHNLQATRMTIPTQPPQRWQLDGLQIDVGLPWERTFEVKLEANLRFVPVKTEPPINFE